MVGFDDVFDLLFVFDGWMVVDFVVDFVGEYFMIYVGCVCLVDVWLGIWVVVIIGMVEIVVVYV